MKAKYKKFLKSVNIAETVVLIVIVFLGSTTITVISYVKYGFPSTKTITVLGEEKADECLVAANSGYDSLGYNYSESTFNGKYCDAYQNAEWCQPYKNVNLIMNWNDAWLSNEDCDRDGELDRHKGYEGYKDSGAWVTNYQSGGYVGEDGRKHFWTWLSKIEAVPTNSEIIDGVWYSLDGEEIGTAIWGSFALTESAYTDDFGGGLKEEELSSAAPGFGR